MLSESREAFARNDFQNHHPTSHEQRSGHSWDESYRNGAAPWDIGRPQPAIVRLASAVQFAGEVLDVGCGTGENALHVASLGLPVLGVDLADTALAIARQKAIDRGLQADFAAADALHLERLGRSFHTVLDCGFFHTCDGGERAQYVASLATITAHGGLVCVLCFRDAGRDSGPHPVREEDLRAVFNTRPGWRIASLCTEVLETRIHAQGVPAWLAMIRRIEPARPGR